MARYLRLCLLLLFGGCGLLCTFSCTTDDIQPAVLLQLDSLQNNRISENGGTCFITASLNGASKKDVTVSLGFSGKAVQGTNYTVSAASISIPAGSLSGSVKVTAINDNLIQGDDSIKIQVLSVSGGVSQSNAPYVLVISDDDLDTDHDGIPDASDQCPADSGSVQNYGCPDGYGLIINEVLYDPSNVGLDGDANGDGLYGQNQDEFIEFYNVSSKPIDVGGYGISMYIIATGLTNLSYTIPTGTTIQPGKALVVFGGGNPKGTFGGSQLLVVGGSGLSMNNTGERVLISDKNGGVLPKLTFDTDALSDNPNESYTRSPDVTGLFVQHHVASPTKALWSPGTKIDGTNF